MLPSSNPAVLPDFSIRDLKGRLFIPSNAPHQAYRCLSGHSLLSSSSSQHELRLGMKAGPHSHNHTRTWDVSQRTCPSLITLQAHWGSFISLDAFISCLGQGNPNPMCSLLAELLSSFLSGRCGYMLQVSAKFHFLTMAGPHHILFYLPVVFIGGA